MKLPAYPLITIDPFMSIWSMDEILTADDTKLWCGDQKTLSASVKVDGKSFRFMGKGRSRLIAQTGLKVTPLVTTYTFENELICLTVDFWTPLFLDDIHIMSTPCSFIDYKVEPLTAGIHKIEISLNLHEDFCYDGKAKPLTGGKKTEDGLSIAFMGQKEQNPLAYTGDGVGIDWGVFYLAGGEASYVSAEEYSLNSVLKGETDGVFTGTHIVAYDDGLSIEYLGEKLKGIWTEKFSDITEAIVYCSKNRQALRKKADEWNGRILEDAAPYGADYQSVLTAAYRQVLAAHKLVRNGAGELLYMSKECHSNGCINTVDVSYPSVPLFLLYNPDLAKGLLNGIFEFARLPVWKGDFAPHDMGQYPVANGQVYALTIKDKEERMKVYLKDEDVFDFNRQMPVEECGNMLIMSWAYALAAKDTEFLKKNLDLLGKWADYLVKTGNDLDLQLCTDDFAGALAQNVNLAIKSCTGIACYGKILTLLKDPAAETYFKAAKANADDIVKRGSSDDRLRLVFNRKNGWSLKYNMVWNFIFDLGLFDDELAAQEVAWYYKKRNKYGVPLDSRRAFTKSDWMIWATTLDKSKKAVGDFASDLVAMLAKTKPRAPFTDWFDTKSAIRYFFCHRTVQGGLWMPVMRDKWSEITKG